MTSFRHLLFHPTLQIVPDSTAIPVPEYTLTSRLLVANRAAVSAKSLLLRDRLGSILSLRDFHRTKV